jgi:hypothetical protein
MKRSKQLLMTMPLGEQIFDQFRCGLNIKNMLVIFFDSEGIVHQEFVPPGQTVDQHYYLEPGLVASP